MAISQRSARVQHLLEEYARKCEKHEREAAHRREVFVKQAREAAERGDIELATRSREWALDTPNRNHLNEYGTKLRSWLNDELVWVRPTNARYSRTYHYSKICSYVFFNYANDFKPLLEGEAKDRSMQPCSRDACKRETFRREFSHRVAAYLAA